MKLDIDFVLANPETIAQFEREAYQAGDAKTADLLDLVSQLVSIVNKQDEQIRDTETLEEWENQHGPASEYKEFFDACFDRLGMHYPCPSVTSDYDKGVIFETIELGEEYRDIKGNE
jgi:hypothetical protein